MNSIVLSAKLSAKRRVGDEAVKAKLKGKRKRT